MFAQGTLDAKPDIDLNAYFILTLNDDASISVIDPLSGVTGISQLYAMIVLEQPGEDWAISADGNRLFVTMPAVGKVAVVDLENFTVITTISTGGHPFRIATQPDGRYVWVGDDALLGGVTIIDTTTLQVAARIPTGNGHHEIAFSGAVAYVPHEHPVVVAPGNLASYAFVTGQDSGTVSIIDTASLQGLGEIDVGGNPNGITVSSLNKAAYISDTSGIITVLDAERHEIIERITATPGTRSIRVSPGQRWAFAVNPTANRVDILDTTWYRLAQSIPIDGAPDKVSFSSGYAYVHAAHSPQIAVIDLALLDKPETIAPVRVIGGQAAPSQAAYELSPADAIVPVHGHSDHVLITNPADKSIYFYMVGMNAPMGSYQTYGRTPRAVRVHDRSIRQIEPGVYTADVRVPRSGQYQVAFLMDTPRIVHCFSFATQAAPTEQAASSGRLLLRVVSIPPAAQAGEQMVIRFALDDAHTRLPVPDLADVSILVTSASGQRTDRYHATPFGDGAYAATLTLPAQGFYKAYIIVPSRTIGVGDLPTLTLRVLGS
jgi:YVTN family beta-propeller protein